MPIRKRTATLSTADQARLADIIRRTGATASAAARVATHTLGEERLEDYEPELDALMDELKATEGRPRIWGYSVPAEDDDLLSTHLRDLDAGLRRVSRSELMRFALRRAANLPDEELQRIHLALDARVIRTPWRAGSSVHDDLIDALGSDFKSITTEELQARINTALDRRVTSCPIQVDVDGAGEVIIRAWRTVSGDTNAANVIRLYPSDSARAFARRLVPFICDAEEGAREAMRHLERN